jgi:hypothetical protein
MRPSTIESLDRMIESIEAQPEEYLLGHTEILQDLRHRRHLLEKFLREYTGPGFTLRHRSQERWRTVLADTAAPGRFRWLEFDVNGFSGHHTYDTQEECLGDMVDSDFEIPDPDALERVSGTPEWRKGTAITAVIQAVNSRLLTWNKALEQIEDIRRAYEEEVA